MTEKFKYSDEKIKELLDGIYSGEITEYNIPEDLYFAIADYLRSGVYQGFGGDLTKFKGKDLELLTELRENTYMFSAAKSYQELKEIGSLMFNEDGSLRNQREFTQLGEQTFEKWNEAWGLTERQTAIGQAQMASKWNEIEKNKDLLPILVFSTAGKGCEECAPYNNFSAKVEDPIWSWLAPLLHFNCECVLMQEENDYAVTNKDEYDKITSLKDTVPKEFQMNPGKDKIIFSDEHPYFDVVKKDIPFAKENFGLPIPSVAEEIGKTAIKFNPDDYNKYSKYKELDKNIAKQRKNDKIISSISNKNFVSLLGDTPIEGIANIKVETAFYESKMGGTVEALMNNDKYFSKIIIDKANTTELEISHFDIKGAKSEGLGTKCFMNILNSAKESGFDEIYLEAAKAEGYNGYYTWARFGFDFNPLYAKYEKPIFEKLISSSEVEVIKNSKNLTDLMSTEEGRIFWKKNGFQYHGKFDVQKDYDKFMDYFSKKITK